MQEIDKLILNFDASSVWVLNACLALIMYGVALDIDLDIFKKVLKHPKSLIIGLTSQWIALPTITLLLIFLWKPIPSFALGMILVAACPGGNISNFFSALAGAKVELSIGMTIISSLASLVFTPFMFAFCGNLYAPTREILQTISIDWMQVVLAILVIIIIPIIFGQLSRKHLSNLVARIKKPLRWMSMLLFLVIIVVALLNNIEAFKTYIGYIFLLVLVHNGLAISSGYILSRGFGLELSEQKAISIETGIQNSGLGLLLIFNFFDGLGGMAIIAAWWGIWHIISGFGIAYIFSLYPKKKSFQ